MGVLEPASTALQERAKGASSSVGQFMAGPPGWAPIWSIDTTRASSTSSRPGSSIVGMWP
jgi:hypothetical protein